MATHDRYHLIDGICHELRGTEATKAEALRWARGEQLLGRRVVVFDSMARRGAVDTWTFAADGCVTSRRPEFV